MRMEDCNWQDSQASTFCSKGIILDYGKKSHSDISFGITLIVTNEMSEGSDFFPFFSK